MFATAQMFSSTDSFALLAVPFFVLSGVIMNSGIAARLVNFAKLVYWQTAWLALLHQHRRQYDVRCNFRIDSAPQPLSAA